MRQIYYYNKLQCNLIGIMSNLKLNSIFKTVCIASDHAGFNLKEDIKNHLVNKKVSIFDIGPYTNKSVDYPDYAKKLGNRIKLKKSDVGILVCGSGIGMSMAANRHKKIRAAVCYSVKNTKLSRLHNNANVITLGSRLTKKNTAFKCIEAFINTKFEGGRHNKRVKKL